MPRLLMFLAARATSVDARTNQMSLFEVLEEVNAYAYPTRLPRVDFVTLWQRQPGEDHLTYEQNIRIVGPEAEESSVMSSHFTMNRPRHRIINRVLDLPIPRPGEFKLELYLRQAGAEEWGLPVRVLPLWVSLRRRSATGGQA